MIKALKIANKAKLKRKLFVKSPETSNALEREIAIMKKLVFYNTRKANIHY